MTNKTVGKAVSGERILHIKRFEKGPIIDYSEFLNTLRDDTALESKAAT